jgi:hypothetical protein
LDKLIELLLREWETVRSAPITILILFGAASGIAGQVWKWYYRKQIEDRDARIQLLLAQLKSQEIDVDALLLNQAVDAAYYRMIEEWARKKARDLDDKR